MPEELRRFKEANPDWDKLPPNRYASHSFLMENSGAYRQLRGIDFPTEDLDFDLLGEPTKRK